MQSGFWKAKRTRREIFARNLILRMIECRGRNPSIVKAAAERLAMIGVW
jgi:hypothetical protein